MRIRRACTLVLILISRASGADTCATHYSELAKTERLQSLQALFQMSDHVGLVNETKGSYITLESRQDILTMGFYSSGIFDLFPIKREGPVKFCDTGQKLLMIGLGQTVDIQLSSGTLTAGGSGPKRTFTSGPMPDLLKKLHHLNDHGLALDN